MALHHSYDMGFPCGSADKESACNVGDLGLIPGLGKSPGDGKGYPLQCSGLITIKKVILTSSNTLVQLSPTPLGWHAETPSQAFFSLSFVT